MRRLWSKALRFRNVFRQLTAPALVLVLAAPAFAQGASPWENAVSVLQQAFTSTIARGLSLVAIVVSGLTFAFGEGGSKRVLAGVLFGVGMANRSGPVVAFSRQLKHWPERRRTWRKVSTRTFESPRSVQSLRYTHTGRLPVLRS